MQAYIGVKMVEAEPAERGGQPGYRVRYDNGYESWSPQDVFEAAYLPLEDPTRITEDIVDDFFTADGGATRLDNHQVVLLNTRSGFSIVESGACVDPANFDAQIGHEVAYNKAKSRLWSYLGFVLAWARNGLK